MQRLIFAGLIVIVLAACSKNDAQVLEPAGLTPVRIGMTPDEAAKALGAALTPRGEREEEACWYTHRADREARRYVDYMVVEGKIARIDVYTPDIKTAEHVGQGTTLDELNAVYAGPRLTVMPHKYADGPRSYYVKWTDLNPTRGLLFEVVDGIVTTFRGGLINEIAWVEGCS